MGKDDSSLKKRRKITSVSSAPTEINKPVEVDIYQQVVSFEETEAHQRSAEKDALLFHKFCEDIRQIFDEIAELKTKNTPEAQEEITSKRIQATLYLVTLKKLNRLEKVRTKAGRDALHKEKQRLDSTHLLLQNLLYETEHLDKEVTKCLQFKSKDEEIDLVPVEEFYKSAPEKISRPEVTKKDSHQLRLARLNWELQQRMELSKACSGLQESARIVSETLTATRARLDSLAPRLKDALSAAEPLKEALGVTGPDLSNSGLRGPANLLPKPLFLFYSRALAYAEAFGHDIVQVAISGDEDEAKRLEQETTLKFDESDSEQEDIKEEEDLNKKKRHHRSGAKISKQEKADQKLKQIIQTHPLVVQLTMKLKEVSLTMTFSYLIHLNIVTVKSSSEIAKPSGISSADVLNCPSVLYGLYPGDSGSDSPHPATSYMLRSAGVSDPFSKFIPQLGHPYIWAQRMCGLEFLSSSSDVDGSSFVLKEPCPNLSSASVENVLIVLKRRLKARISLMKELQDLESGNISPLDGTGGAQVRLLGSLTVWQSISWTEYSSAVSVSQLINSELVGQQDIFYRAIITRQSAKLVALVALKNDYPKRAPIFSLTLHWNGTHHAGTDDDIRDIERCVNTDWCVADTNKPNITLTSQLTRLLCCLDVLLEASGSSEFPPDKVMFRPVKGRNRIKPYKFVKQGTGVFIQH